MKILIDLTSLADNFSGIERFALSISKELIRHNKNKYILVFKNAVHPAFNSIQDVRKIILKGKNKLIFNQFVLPINLWRINADCYLFLAFPAPFLFFSKNAISAIHDIGCWDCPETNKRGMVAYFRVLYRKAALSHKKIVTVSEFSKNRIIQKLNVRPDDIWVIRNGVSECFLDFHYDEKKEKEIRQKIQLPKKYILCLSTIEPRKNLRLLIDAFNDLKNNGRFDYELVLVGRKGWKIDSILDGISEVTRSHILFTGFVEDESLPYIYRNASLFVFPSLYEGFGVPPVEAIACGTPVLSSDATAMPEVLGDAAVYFENNNKQDLEQKIVKMLDGGMRAEGKTKKYIWGEQADKLYGWIEMVFATNEK